VTDTRATADRCSCGVALDGPLGQAYNEEAFRYFLEIERKRSELSNRPLLLLLIDLKTDAGSDDRMPSGTASSLLAGLFETLRETDFLGWYREQRVIGAVLTQCVDAPKADVSTEISTRVTEALSAGLVAADARRLQVRVFQLPPRAED